MVRGWLDTLEPQIKSLSLHISVQDSLDRDAVEILLGELITRKYRQRMNELYYDPEVGIYNELTDNKGGP